MIILLNPRSAIHNRRIPLSLVTTGAGLEGQYDYDIIDENFERDVDSVLDSFIDENRLGSTVYTYALVIGYSVGPRLYIGWPNA